MFPKGRYPRRGKDSADLGWFGRYLPSRPFLPRSLLSSPSLKQPKNPQYGQEQDMLL
jgi:hypothetical protein